MESKWESVAENLVRHVSSGGLYLRAKVGGKIIRRSLRTKAVRVAKAKRDSLLSELRDEQGVDRSGCQEKLVTTAAVELARDYYSSLPSYRSKPANMVYRNQTFVVLLKTLPSSPPHEWTEKDLREWWSSAGVVRYSETRRNGTLDTLRKMIELLIERGDFRDDPSRKLQRVSVHTKEIIVPTREEFRAILDDVRSQKKRVSRESADFIAFLAYSGCRIGETREIRAEDIGRDFIRVTGGELRTKNSRSRNVPIIPAMAALLESMGVRDESGPIFSMKSPRFALMNSCERLKFPHYTPHTMRHLFVTSCIESGVDIPTVAKWIGHRDGGALVMKTYGHLRDDHSVKQAGRVGF